MKKHDSLTWSLIAALCLMVMIAGVLLLKSYKSTKTNQNSMLELEVNLTNVMDELEQAKMLASEKEAELETQTAAHQQAIDEMQAVLNTTVEDRDALSARVQSMTLEADQAAKDAEALQGRYNTAFTALGIQKQRIEALNSQIDALKSGQENDGASSTEELNALREALDKSQADLAAAQQENAGLKEQAAALNAQIDEAQAVAGQSAEEAAAKADALSQELAKAQAALNAANKMKAALNNNISTLNTQLAAAKAAASQSATEAAAKADALSDELEKAKTDLEEANKEKETLNETIAALNAQIDEAHTAAGQNSEEAAAKAAALTDELEKAKAGLEEANKELEQANKEKETLNAQLETAQNDLAQTREILVATTSAMEKAGEEAGVSIAALEEKNKALTDEAAKLRGSLEAETQKSAELQEEVDVLSANPGALQKRLLVLAGANEAEQKEGLRALAGVILRVFRESIPADTEGSVTHPVAVSVLVDGEDAMTISYDLTKAQEAQAYEAAGKLNDAQKLFRIDLNHDQTAAVVINGTAFSKEAFEAVRAEVFSRNPAASKAELIRLTTDELVRTLVLREHAEAAGIDPDAEDMESRLWEEALKTVAVNDEEFAAALEKRQQEEDAVLAADPAQYARMLEEGRIASAVLPEGSRFIKQLIVTVDVSCMEKISASLKDAEGKLKTVTARINDQSSEKEKEERKTLARQVNQLTNELNLLQSKEKKAKETAAALASSIRRNQATFEVASALAERDEAMPAVGYAVFKGAQVPDEKLVAAALALEHPGDVSEPIRLADGFHVLYYSEEITPDSDVIQKAQEMLRQEMLEPLKKAMQESLLNKWIGEAQVVSNVK